MKALLILIAVLGSVVADFRPECTAEQMEGLNVVGYAYDRVFRLPDYSHMLQLDEEFMYTKRIVQGRSSVTTTDFMKLVHLHQGFDQNLFVLEYGYSLIEDTFGSYGLLESVKYLDESRLAVLNSTTVALNERMKFYDSGWDNIGSENKHPENKDFSSFVYDDLLYHQGGFTNMSIFYFDSVFVENSNLCVGMKFPVVDIAYKPPICHNRVLNESAPTAHDPDDDDEWIVALVNGIRTTRSEKLCGLNRDTDEHRILTDEGAFILPDHKEYCFYMLKPGMKKPCHFARGSKYLFYDIQVEPADPVLFATELPSSTVRPPNSNPSSGTDGEGSDGRKKAGETQAASWLLCSGLLFVSFFAYATFLSI